MNRFAYVLVGLLALSAGLFLSVKFNTDKPVVFKPPSNTDLVGQQQPEFELFDNNGEPKTNAIFAGKTTLINFWATWCVPCREEMPMLMELHTEYAERGFQVVGIALDDVTQVNKFIAEIGISYPILVGEMDVMAVSAAYGNVTGVLPYSVLIDKDGVIRWQYAGEVDRDEFSELLELHL